MYAPNWLVKVGAKLGDIFTIIPFNSTLYKMMLKPNTANTQEFETFTAIIHRSFEQGLATEPLTVQSMACARLFFLKAYN